MKLVDPSGNEVTSKENKNAKVLQKQLSSKTEDLLEPILNKVKLSGSRIPQQQLMQLSSAAHQMLFNRMIYNLIQKIGIENLDELLTEDDVEELKTSLSNQIKFADSSEVEEMVKQQQQGKPDKS